MRLNIFTKIVGVPVAGMLILAATITFFVNYYVSKNFDAEAVQKLLVNQQAFNAQVNDTKKQTMFAAQFLALRKETLTALEAGDVALIKQFAKQLISMGYVDVVTVSDGTGKVIARGHSDKSGDSVATQRNVKQALSGNSTVETEQGSVASLAIRAGVPIISNNKIIGVVTTGFTLSSLSFVDSMKQRIGAECTIFNGSTRIATTIESNGQRAVGTKMDNPEVLNTVLEKKQSFTARNTILGASYDTIYWPILTSSGEAQGMFFIGQPRAVVEQAQKSIFNSILYIALGVTALIVLGTMGVARSISRPIINATHFSSEVAAGKLDGQLTVTSQDEIGTLSHALNTMVAELRDMIIKADTKTAEAAEQAEKAQLATQEAEKAKTAAERAKKDGMTQAAGHIEAVVSAVTSAADELESELARSNDGVEIQSRRVTETASAMEQMNCTVLEVAKNAATAASVTDQANAKASEGQGAVSSMVESIGLVQNKSLTLKHEMNALGQLAENTGQILKVISEIADQTNLLALNAAIEAARAGDAGRGFAVVADEVRKLAEKTMVATNEVGEAVRSIQQGTRSNMDHVDGVGASIEELTALAHQSGNVLQEIVQLIHSASQEVRQIATAAEEQSATSSLINQAVEQVAKISVDTAETMQHSSQVVHGLAEQVHVLERLVEEMKQG